MTTASHLQPTREYLLWWETHKDRWVATPIVRSGPILVEVNYNGAITVRVVDQNTPATDPDSTGHVL